MTRRPGSRGAAPGLPRPGQEGTPDASGNGSGNGCCSASRMSDQGPAAGRATGRVDNPRHRSLQCAGTVTTKGGRTRARARRRLDRCACDRPDDRARSRRSRSASRSRRTYRGSHYKMTHRSTIDHARPHRRGRSSARPTRATRTRASLEIERDRPRRDRAAPRRPRTPSRVERCWELARPATFDILRDRRLGLVARACVDTAIWDAIGKALGQPLWRLWGGYRDTLPMITIGGYYGTGSDDRGRRSTELRERGLAGMKFKVGGLDAGGGRRALPRRARGGRAATSSSPPTPTRAGRPAEAIRFARLVADFDLHWFEEPCRWANDRRAMRDVRFAAGVRVCAGQSEFSAGGCRDLMVEGAIDVCNFDASWSGGADRVATGRRGGARLRRRDGPPRGAAGRIHLLASIPHGTFRRVLPPRPRPDLVEPRREPAAARRRLARRCRRGPGLGWELDADYIEAHRVPPRS